MLLETDRCTRTITGIPFTFIYHSFFLLSGKIQIFVRFFVSLITNYRSRFLAGLRWSVFITELFTPIVNETFNGIWVIESLRNYPEFFSMFEPISSVIFYGKSQFFSRYPISPISFFLYSLGWILCYMDSNYYFYPDDHHITEHFSAFWPRQGIYQLFFCFRFRFLLLDD